MSANAKPSVLIRADASSAIGTGHFVRCYALARELNLRGWDVAFAARELPEVLQSELDRAGYGLVTIPAEVSLLNEPRYLQATIPAPFTVLISDHYEVDAEWHRRASAIAGTLATVDDLARGEQAVNVVVNQNLGFAATDYDGLVPKQCRVLIGPQYAMLRPEFREARAAGLRARTQVQRVLVFLSGGDTHNVTYTVVGAIATTAAKIDVITGGAYPHAESLRNLASHSARLTVHENTRDMAGLMLLADLAVGAPSSASWERCCLGLPAITITLAENQVRVAEALAEAGATISLGWYHEVDGSAVANAVAELSRSPSRLREMSRSAAEITDGGGAERVADVLAEIAESGEVKQEGIG